MANTSQKLKMLYLMKMFEEETDPDNGLTMAQIIEYLYEHGISAERKSLYRDIKMLREFGMDIRKYQRQPVEYALAERDFEISELMLLVDAVQSSRFLSDGKSNALVKSIRLLASRNQQKLLNKQVNVHGRPKTQAQSDFVNVDQIQEAIRTKKKIRFKYYKYNLNLEKVERHPDKDYVTTPVSLIYSDDNYYLVGFSDTYETFTHFRVDRMGFIQVTDEPAVRNSEIAEFDPRALTSKAFSMYRGEPVVARLRAQENVMNIIADKFGTDVITIPQDDGTTIVETSVLMSPVLYGWIAEMGTDVVIEGPSKLREAYVMYLYDVIMQYGAIEEE